MSPVQSATDYSAEHGKAWAGQRVNFRIFDIDSKAAEDSVIGMGLAVVEGSSPEQCKIPTAAAQRFLGVSEYTSAGMYDADEDHTYRENSEVNIVKYGPVWVYTETAVSAGDQAYFRHTAPGAETVGAFRNDWDEGNCDPADGCYFDSDADAGALVKLMVNVGNIVPVTTGEEDFTAAGDVDVTKRLINFDSTAGALAAGLPDPLFEGQKITLYMSVDGGDVVVTPDSTAYGFATLTFNDVGDIATLEAVEGAWSLIGQNGVTIA